MSDQLTYDAAVRMRRAAMAGARAARLASLVNTVKANIEVAKHYNRVCLQRRRDLTRSI